MIKKSKKQLEEQAPRKVEIDQTINSVEENEKDFEHGQQEEFKEEKTHRDFEALQKDRVKNYNQALSKDHPSLKDHLKSEMRLNSIRGKIHPSKKGLGKTISRKAVKRLASQKKEQ